MPTVFVPKGIGFARKISDGNWGSIEFSVHGEIVGLADDASNEEKQHAVVRAYAAASMLVNKEVERAGLSENLVGVRERYMGRAVRDGEPQQGGS